MPYRDDQPRCGRRTSYGTRCTIATSGGPCHWHQPGSTLRRELVGLDDLRRELDPTFPVEPTP